jgi:hypothetical protein
MKAFIDEHRDVYGVEPIRRGLPIAPSTYYTHAARQANPDRASLRVRRDAVLCTRSGACGKKTSGACGALHRIRMASHSTVGPGPAGQAKRTEGCSTVTIR